MRCRCALGAIEGIGALTLAAKDLSSQTAHMQGRRPSPDGCCAFCGDSGCYLGLISGQPSGLGWWRANGKEQIADSKMGRMAPAAGGLACEWKLVRDATQSLGSESAIHQMDCGLRRLFFRSGSG